MTSDLDRLEERSRSARTRGVSPAVGRVEARLALRGVWLSSVTREGDDRCGLLHRHQCPFLMFLTRLRTGFAGFTSTTRKLTRFKYAATLVGALAVVALSPATARGRRRPLWP